MPIKKRVLFEKETDLCAAFLAQIPKNDWTNYNEHGGFDILLSRNEDGFQIGIQAKLSFNVHLLSQATEDIYDITSAGPDVRAILVPANEKRDLDFIARHLGLTVIRCEPWTRGMNRSFRPWLPSTRDRWSSEDWHEMMPVKRVKLPEYIPDVPAGASAPIQLTAWKINALKIAIILDQRGFLTRADFKHIGIDHRRWITDSGWLIASERGWIAGPRFPAFKKNHPRVWKEIKADQKKWMPKELPIPAVQQKLAFGAK